MKPINLKIQNYYTQTGVENDIAFMWKYNEGVHRQEAYMISVYHNNNLIYSTGRVKSSEQNNIHLHLDLNEQKDILWNGSSQKLQA